jgi:hypothetical protein
VHVTAASHYGSDPAYAVIINMLSTLSIFLYEYSFVRFFKPLDRRTGAATGHLRYGEGCVALSQIRPRAFLGGA